MAIVTRFFSTSGAGAADGTTWADRAALFSAGNWSTVITGFNFAGSDSLKCLIGPGSYTCSQSLASGLFANAPTIANPLFLFGCDSSGNPLETPDPDWVSAMPAWDDSTLPVIATTTNISTINLAATFARLIKFTASGATSLSVLNTAGFYDWVIAVNSASNTSASLISSNASNSVFSCTGSSYNSIATVGNTSVFDNCRLEGNAGSSGNRRGYTTTTTDRYSRLARCTIVNNGGAGVVLSSANTSQTLMVERCVIANNGGDGVTYGTTASQVSLQHLRGCVISGNGGFGVNGQSGAARAWVTNNRLRDNTSGNLDGLGNYPTDLNNYTTDSDDATEYVSTGANGDFRIQNSATIWGMGFGAGEEAAAGGGINAPRFMTGGLT